MPRIKLWISYHIAEYKQLIKLQTSFIQSIFSIYIQYSIFRIYIQYLVFVFNIRYSIFSIHDSMTGCKILMNILQMNVQRVNFIVTFLKIIISNFVKKDCKICINQ